MATAYNTPYTPPNVTPEALFYQQYEAVRRDEIVGILLALFLGVFGAHQFYLRRTGLGIVYLCLFWTGIPALLGVIECFFMPGRVREFNAVQAAAIAAALGIPLPGWGHAVHVTVNMPPAANAGGYAQGQASTLNACPRCQRTNPAGSRFCAGCGGQLV